MRVGILELISYTSTSEWSAFRPANSLRRQFYSVMPQVVAAWCRELGHDVHCATHYGQDDPRALLPDDLDMVFIAGATQTSALAYALAKLYRRDGVLTVAGGPHAKSFPDDCARFFDLTVKECDRSLIDDILSRRFDPPAILSSDAPPNTFPSVTDRMPEIAVAAGFDRGALGPKAVSILSSIGCPFACEFCTEWNRTYQPVPKENLLADLDYISKHLPSVIVAYHDPNFAVHFDETLGVIEQIPAARRNRYIMECSLSVLRASRLPKLKETNCLYLAPGIESWANFHQKAGIAGKIGEEKLAHVLDHLRLVKRYVPGLQANFIFGLDCDEGDEPVELIKIFIRSLPAVWPNLNIPTPYGGTPMFDRFMDDGRILTTLPLAFYCSPYLAFTIKNYRPDEYYAQIIEMYELIASMHMLLRRVFAKGPLLVRLSNVMRTLAMRAELREMRQIHRMLTSDRHFRLFHEGRTKEVPAFYHRRFEQRLGRYAELISRSEREPVLSVIPS
jgi:radical SAM superfamily enzyme YgiQ (UPF0313 family)